MNKKLLYVFCTLTVLVFAAVMPIGICAAVSADEFLENYSKESAPELAEIEAMIEQNSLFYSSINKSINTDPQNKDKEATVTTSNAFRLYRHKQNKDINYNDFIDAGSVENLLSDKYSWALPSYATNAYTLFRYDEVKQVWIWSSSGSGINKPDDSGNIVVTDYSLPALAKTITTEIEDVDISSIKVTSGPAFSSSSFLVYARTYGGTEYLIPYCARPDFTDAVNGKIYPAEELLKIFGSMKNNGGGIPADVDNPTTYGGSGYVSTGDPDYSAAAGVDTEVTGSDSVTDTDSASRTVPAVWIIAAIIGLLLISGAIALFVKKSRKSRE